MNDEEKQAVVTDEVTAVGDDTNQVSPTELQTESTEVEASSQASEEQETQGDYKTGPRESKRIHQLLSKLKGADTANDRGQVPPTNTVSDVLGLDGTPPWWKPAQSGFTPNEEGYITPEQLEAEVNRKAAATSQLMIAQYDQEQKYRKAVENFTDDLEGLLEAPEFKNGSVDKKLEQDLVDTYNEINTDSRGQFVPKTKASVIFQRLLNARKSGQTKGAMEVSTKLEKSVAEAAISPNAGAVSSTTEKDNLFAQAVQSGTDESWAQYLKKVVPAPKS